MVVYLDRVFLLNLLVDYLLLLSAAQLSGRTLSRLRLLLCAAGGGLYAAATFLPGCGFLRGPLCQLAAGGAMALCAFRGRRRPALLFLLLSGGLAGFVLALGLWAGSPTALLHRIYRGEMNWPLLLGAALCFYLLLRLLLGQGARHGGGERLKVTISVCGRKQTVTALHDTGNTLRDPVSGRPALVLEREAAEDLWPPDVAAVLAGPQRGRAIGSAAGGPQRLHRDQWAALPTDTGGADGAPHQRRRVPRPVGRSGWGGGDGGCGSCCCGC